ncbi:MAG TPA: hypothetical protein VGB37_11380 [Candidatus Lokiarchaeia archaeon]
MNLDDFIKKRFISEIPKKPIITDEDLFDLIKAIMDMKYPDDRHLHYWLEILKKNLPCGEQISDLIFWNDLTPEEVFKKAQIPTIQTYTCEICGKEIVGTYMFNKHKEEHE